MTIDKSLKVKGSGTQNRNVLTRAERIEKLIASEKFKEGDKVLGLPKVRVMKLSLKKKKKVKAEEGADGKAAPAAGKPAAGGKAPAAAAKPAAKK
ncbi:small basic protein [Anatilimnocola floriformis]|uniref:small basic protein n=1 Tax=Anatilimnocola floriformis TaxID=2948575 RepID=UPI0020C3AEE8|nr:small basic protein [Anatilimnocola floriformis]